MNLGGSRIKLRFVLWIVSIVGILLSKTEAAPQDYDMGGSEDGSGTEIVYLPYTILAVCYVNLIIC